MAKKSIKLNYIYNVLYQILSLIVPLITAPYLSRVLGADGVGTYSYVESISSYFVLFATLGMTTFGQREISYVQDDRKKRTQIFWETNILEFFTSIVVIAVYVVFSLKQKNSSLYLVLVFNLISVIANISWFFQGLEEFGKIVARNAIIKLINILFIFSLIKKPEDLILYLFGVSFFAFLGNASLWLSVARYVDKPDFKTLHPLRHMKTILALFVPTIAIQVYTVLDKTMIGLITKNAFENGYYEQATKIVKTVLTIITSLGTVMVPRIGFHFNKGNSDEVKRYMYKAYQFVWLLGIPLCFGIIMVSGNFVPWFFGTGYEKVAPLMSILALLILAIGINNVTGMQYLIPTKRQETFTITVIIGSIVNFILNILLISRFQAYGAAVASVAAESAIAIVQIILVRKELSPWEIIKRGYHYYVAGGIMAIVLYFLSRKLVPSIMNTILLVMIGTIVYLILLLAMHDMFLLENIRSINNKLFKKIRK